MDSYLTQSNIIFTLGLLGILFTVYNYFRDPQINLDKKQALDNEDMENKAKALVQQVQWEKESNTDKFNALQEDIKNAFTLAENHTHTVEVKVDNLVANVSRAELAIVRLATVIEERIPKK